MYFLVATKDVGDHVGGLHAGLGARVDPLGSEDPLEATGSEPGCPDPGVAGDRLSEWTVPALVEGGAYSAGS